MRAWQSAMIGLARNKRLTAYMHGARWARHLSSSFVGGADAAEAVRTALVLQSEGLRASLFYLGEYVEAPELVEENVQALLGALPLAARAGLELHASVDPTQIGSLQSWDSCHRNAERLAQAIAEEGRGVPLRALMLDMEDASVTGKTLDLFHRLRDRGLPAAVTVQAYLHRTADDLGRLIERGVFVRLVKGAFAEPASVAQVTRQGRDAAYRACVDRLFSREAMERGVYPALGTHDEAMIEHGVRAAQANGWTHDRWEVEMLLGVRPALQRALRARGLRVRLYLPFGRDWFPYSMRRVGETPRNLAFVARALFGFGGR